MEPTVHEILQSEPCRAGLEQLCSELGEKPDRVERLTARSLQEMMARHDQIATHAYQIIGGLLSRRFRIDVDHDALRRLQAIDKEHAIAWLPSHRSYLDMFYLEQVIQQSGMQPSFVLGGDNLDFWPIGPILRRAGILYIRRATRDDPVYRFALRTYLAHLVSQRRNLTWSLEGGRTRTGKLRPPRYGALKYVVDAVRQRDDANVMMVPVSVVYDQLPEVEAMTDEALGGTKQ
ncbi:MAG: 1-acyl-sn-glycerol-3-phosphate acyltransferase, partial [Polyangiales bacterium]